VIFCQKNPQIKINWSFFERKNMNDANANLFMLNLLTLMVVFNKIIDMKLTGHFNKVPDSLKKFSNRLPSKKRFLSALFLK
jgi:hypothetical protein